MKIKKNCWAKPLAFFIMLTTVMMYSVTNVAFADPIEDLGGPPQPKASISLEKNVNLQTINFKDTEVTYTFNVRNSGGKELTNVVLADSAIGMSNIIIGTMAPGATTQCSFTVNLSTIAASNWVEHHGDIEFKNTAQVSANYMDGIDVKSCYDSNDATVEYIPAVTLKKSVDEDVVHFTDADVKYTFKIKNNLSVDLTNLVLTDPKLAATIAIPQLNAGASYTTELAFNLVNVAWDANNKFTNNATVTGTVGSEDQVKNIEASDEATITYVPALTLEKTVNKKTVNFKNADVEYSFKVKNNLDDRLINVVIIDSTINKTIPIGNMNKGQTVTKHVDFNLNGVTWSAINEFVNEARVEAPYTRGEAQVTLSAIDNAVVTYVPPMTLVKTVSPSIVYHVNETVDYTFTIYNNFEDQELKNVVLSDPLIGVNITVGSIHAKDHHHTGLYTTTVAFGLTSGAWENNQFVNEAKAKGSYESKIEGIRPTGEVSILCEYETITLEAIDTATVTFDPTTVTIYKDVPGIEDTQVFDVTIFKEVPYEEESFVNDAVMQEMTLEAIKVVPISEGTPYVFEVTESGMYTFVETTRAGYTTSQASFEIEVAVGENGDQTVTFINTKDVNEETGTTTTTRRSPGNTIPEPEVPLANLPAETPVITDEPTPLADLVPQTSDTGNIWLLLGLMFSSGAGIIFLGRRKQGQVK